ncbi:hypothetical protein [Methyloferula stellata]|uniref:hypothetical protein n=1 Tax=Methyloferula stellata TaxID=876270 RepID=UPI00037EFB54|nr:hypothetical protein [Methyloferula stellata]
MAEPNPSIYRVFRLDIEGRITGSEILEAEDDLDALTRAQTKIDAFGIELWDRDRLIARLGPEKLSATQ